MLSNRLPRRAGGRGRPVSSSRRWGSTSFPGYVWGRAAALGTPPSALVAATFGVFEPTLIAAVFEAGSSTVDRGDILAARTDGAAESIAAVAGADECAALADPLLDALAGLDPLGRPLFSALRRAPRSAISQRTALAGGRAGPRASRRRTPGGAGELRVSMPPRRTCSPNAGSGSGSGSTAQPEGSDPTR